MSVVSAEPVFPAPRPVLDVPYRDMVRDATGASYLDTLTANSLAAVNTWLESKPPAEPHVAGAAHRLSGGVATVGLPTLAAALQTLERLCAIPCSANDWEASVAQCRDGVQASHAALAAEAASIRSSR